MGGRAELPGSAANLPPPTLLENYIPEPDFAAQVGVTLRTARHWRRMGESPPFIVVGRGVYYLRSAIQKWLASLEEQE